MKLAWIDVETTGLEPKNDLLLEIAVVVTDTRMNELSRFSIVIGHSPLNIIATKMSNYVTDLHLSNGLIEETIKPENPTTKEAYYKIKTWLTNLIHENSTNEPIRMAGKQCTFDYKFLPKELTNLLERNGEKHFDIDTLVAWFPGLYKKMNKVGRQHRALSDLLQDIAFCKHLIDNKLVKIEE